jgi:tetratricopeptide (TPR) repeat protein
MTKRIITIITLALMSATALMAATAAHHDKAAEAYKQELYKEALSIYLADANAGRASADLYYNIGNTYYRLKDNARAILYYEKALRLDPGCSDARYNLEFVRSRAGIDEDQGANIFSIWMQQAMSRLSSNTWAVIALVAFLLTLVAIAVYIFVDAVAWRKVGFFGAILAFVITIVSLVCAWQMHDRAIHHNEAIVIANPASLSTSPRTPKDKTEVAFELAAGCKVSIIDKVETAGTLWYHIETNRRQAWIAAKQLEVI